VRPWSSRFLASRADKMTPTQQPLVIAGLWGTVQLVFVAALAGMIAGSVPTFIYSPQKSVLICPDAAIAPLKAQNDPSRLGH
jgi:hypothetical protein